MRGSAFFAVLVLVLKAEGNHQDAKDTKFTKRVSKTCEPSQGEMDFLTRFARR